MFIFIDFFAGNVKDDGKLSVVLSRQMANGIVHVPNDIVNIVSNTA